MSSMLSSGRMEAKPGSVVNVSAFGNEAPLRVLSLFCAFKAQKETTLDYLYAVRVMKISEIGPILFKFSIDVD